jgi:hypothetical protein
MSSTPPEAPPYDHKYPTGFRLALLMTSLYIAMFLVALDCLNAFKRLPRATC